MLRSIVRLPVLGAVCAAVTLSATPSLAQQTGVKMLVISGDVGDRGDAFSAFAFGSEPTLLDYIDAIVEATDDHTVDAIVIRLRDAGLSMTDVEELGSAVARYRTSGKKAHLFTESLGPIEALLGARCDEVIVQTGGPAMLPGLHMEEIFLADTFEWLGVKADMIQVGAYKGANEMYTRAAPSDPWDQNISALLDAQYDEIIDTFVEGRGLSKAEVEAAMGELWLAQAEDAVRLRMADAAVDFGRILPHLEEGYGEVVYGGELTVGDEGPQIDMANPFAMLSTLMDPPVYDATEPTIAILHLDGPIVDGDSTAAGLTGGSSVGSRTLRNAMQDIAADDEIEGVIVRIDSPGGSATASEMIWLGLRELAATKPVWVSVGSMAASGGYYSAVGAERIYVNPSSIVGSIGVVGGKLTFGEAIEKVKVNIVERSRGPRAGMMSLQSGWTESERAFVREKMAQTYEQFADRVRSGRDGIDLDRVGEGRLFLGEDAVKLKMADEVGGLDDALADMAELVGLESYEVMHFPAPPSIDQIIEDAMGSFIRGPWLASMWTGVLEQALGAQRFHDIAAQLEAMLQLRDSRLLLTTPRAVRFRFE